MKTLIYMFVSFIVITLFVSLMFKALRNYPCKEYSYGETTFENLDIGTNQPDFIGPVNRQ